MSTGATLVVVMGVSGSGKSTVGELLAQRLYLPYADADDLHPPENVVKMEAGIPLDDEDRYPWLDVVARWLSDHAEDGGIVTCSALKRRYRDRLRRAHPDVFFLHLDGSEELIAGRMAERSGHFMPGTLLSSQFEALERLEEDERGAAISIEGTPEDTLARAWKVLPGSAGPSGGGVRR